LAEHDCRTQDAACGSPLRREPCYGFEWGIAPSANLNPPRQWPSPFEPVHGSVPDMGGAASTTDAGVTIAAKLG
jgi:hypothetical protein